MSREPQLSFGYFLKEIPKPVSYFVTRWKDDPFAQMAYSYVRTGGSGDDYDELAKEVGDRVFFAGEVGVIIFLVLKSEKL